MSKILITADLHFGLPQKLDDVLWAVKKIRSYAAENDIDVIVVCGDIFHDRVNYNIEVLNATYAFFKEAKDLGQDWIIFPGNHDMPLRNSWDIHALKPLDQIATVIDNIKLIKIYGKRFWVIPFIHYESVYMKILNDIEKQYEDGDVLLTHVGVNNATLNECFLIKHWSVVDFTKSKFNKIFAGHFHCHQNVGHNVWYPGSPIPFRYDEGMVPHGFIEFDVESQEIEFIKIFDIESNEDRPPDYITITDDILSDNLDLSSFRGDNVRIQLTRDYSRDEILQIRHDLESLGIKQIKLNKVKDDKIDLQKSGAKNDLSLTSPEDLFNQWVDYDQPKKLDLDLLKKLNSEILKLST